MAIDTTAITLTGIDADMTTDLTNEALKELPSSVRHQVDQWSHGTFATHVNDIAQETAVALIYNGTSHVVMMASPDNLSNLALGFSLSEGIVDRPEDIFDIVISQKELGIEVDITICSRAMWGLKQQRRNMTGRTGCGLCGAESLKQAVRAPSSRPVSSRLRKITKLTHDAIQSAVANLQLFQPLQQLTGAVHGAVWCNSDGKILVAREDIGRHNALDKLIGALWKDQRSAHERADKDIPNLADGFALISSRASYEMVTKADYAGISMLVAVSAPTTMAITLAKKTGITLVGFARNGRHTFYT